MADFGDPNEFPDGVKITVTDAKTGNLIEEKVCKNDYAVIVHGTRYVKSHQMMGRPGRTTHMIAIAHREAP